ncbi:MAG: flagellar motor protein MotB [Lachnospiraceae bacterium]|nr:flagellar motor protein MotB [Lachnospiraceae bacterium]MDE6231730.1 flagellar motor protein MotB [Lachnospiraceae bacterium]MDE6253708.1 flagellar motor protein MotB [Lachnospiraceae bacterium]
MARKKKEEEQAPGSPAWMATFSDLMNLLLCFFVLLFAMSSVDQDKFEELVASLSASFGILEGGAASVIEGSKISTGVSDLNELDDYYENLGLNTEGEAKDINDNNSEYDGDTVLEQIQKEGTAESEKMAEEMEQEAIQKNIASQVEIEFTAQYVQLTLNGALLFDSAKSNIRSDAVPLVDKVGDILMNYKGNMVEITGFTDSVPLLDDPKYDDNWDLSSARAKSVLMYLVNNKGMDISIMKASGRGENDPIASNDTAEGRAQNRRVEIKIYNQLNSY